MKDCNYLVQYAQPDNRTGLLMFRARTSDGARRKVLNRYPQLKDAIISVTLQFPKGTV